MVPSWNLIRDLKQFERRPRANFKKFAADLGQAIPAGWPVYLRPATGDVCF
jgi:hypothetical protein